MPAAWRDRGGGPAVSVVVAAYNRAHLLDRALRSILRQSMADFEVLVVGDACTDESEGVVAALGDPRLTFLNLPLNMGDQSGPNNVGIARARGRFVAFLNQDDLWLPDHLEVCLAWIEATGADIVHALAARVSVAAPGADPAAWTAGMAAGGPHFDPARDFSPCSTWLVRAAVFERIGPFRPALDCVIEPSQDLLFRAWRAGLAHRRVPNVSVVVIPSSERPGSYVGRDGAEHEAVLAVLSRPGGRMELLARLPSLTPSRPRRILEGLAAGLLRPLGRLGIPPRTIRFALARRVRRGGFVQGLRAIRGLDPIWHGHELLTALKARELARAPTDAPGRRIAFGVEGDGGRHRERGWCSPEAGGTWTGEREATLLFRLDPDAARADLRLVLEATPFTAPGHAAQGLRVLVGDALLYEGALGEGAGPPPIAIPAAARGPDPHLRVTLHLPDARSPSSLGASDDVRRLGLHVAAATLEIDPGPTEA